VALLPFSSASKVPAALTSVITDKGGQFFNVKAFGAKGDGVTDDGAALQAAQNAAGAIGGAVIYPPGNYLTNSPITWYVKSATTGNVGPSMLGGWGQGGSSADIGLFGNVRLTAGPSFPVGEFMIDYIGSATTGFAATVGYNVRGFAIECNSRAAGVRFANNEGTIFEDAIINNAATPNPADTTGSPSGAVSFVLMPNNPGFIDASYMNKINRVYVLLAGQDGFCLTQGASSSVMASDCASLQNGRYGYLTTDGTYLRQCDSQTNQDACYYMKGGSLVDCNVDSFPGKKNAIILDGGNPGGNLHTCNILGGTYYGTGTAGTEQNTAMIRVKNVAQPIRAVVTGATFVVGTQMSDWLYVDGFASTSSLSFNNCDFTPLYNPPTVQKYNLNGTTKTVFRGCPGINPAGPQTAPGIPSTTVPFTNPFPFDCTVFINGGTVSAVAIGGTTTGQTSGMFRVPYGQTITLTYTVVPTSWTWFGD
jgi:hypothetical protein